MTKRRRHYEDGQVGDYSAADINYMVAYFRTGGSPTHFPGMFTERTKKTGWLPWAFGPCLRTFWLAARGQVREECSERAYAFMDARFDTDEARQTENWSFADRDELDVLLGLKSK